MKQNSQALQLQKGLVIFNWLKDEKKNKTQNKGTVKT